MADLPPSPPRSPPRLFRQNAVDSRAAPGAPRGLQRTRRMVASPRRVDRRADFPFLQAQGHRPVERELDFDQVIIDDDDDRIDSRETVKDSEISSRSSSRSRRNTRTQRHKRSRSKSDDDMWMASSTKITRSVSRGGKRVKKHRKSRKVRK